MLNVLLLVTVLGAASSSSRHGKEEPRSLAHLLQKRAACGGPVSSKDGVIQPDTEDHDGTFFYKANENCVWTVKGSPGSRLMFLSNLFELEISDNCEWDYVEIHEKTRDRRTRFCGWNALVYLADDNDVTVTFVTDRSYEDLGFKIQVSEIPANDAGGCTRIIEAAAGTQEQLINDESGGNCFYFIQAPIGYTVEMTAKALSMDTEPCSQERIVLRAGTSSHGDQLGKLCSDTVKGEVFRSNSMFVEYWNEPGNEGERYLLSYVIVEDNFTPAPVTTHAPSPVGGDDDCSRMIEEDDDDATERVIEGPAYQDNKECIVVARAKVPRTVVQITFTNFEIEDSENCEFDSLRLYAGESNSSKEMGGPYCGYSLKGKTFVTTGNSLRMVFTTDESLSFFGYKATIKFVPSNCDCPGKRDVCVVQSYEKSCVSGKVCRKCMNGGTCVESGDSFQCYCLDGFSGTSCENRKGSASSITFTTLPDRFMWKKKDLVILTCTAEDRSSREEAIISWFHKGLVLSKYDQKHNPLGSREGGVLQIDEFADEYVGEYVCVAEVGDSREEYIFELELVEDCKHKFQTGPETATANVGRSAFLNCRIRDETSFRWEKDGVDLDVKNNRDKYKIVGSHALMVNNLELTDNGWYRCVAVDENNCESHREAELTVLNVKEHNDYCGMSVHDEDAQSRLTKAKNALPKDNPWHVTLKADTSDEKIPFCGGSLISQRFVVTAAHCMEEFNATFKTEMRSDNTVLLFGETNCYNSVVKRRVKHITIHGDYGKDETGKSVKYNNDIALIELDRPVQYSTSIRPICLQDEDAIDHVFFKKRQQGGKVAGCGAFNRLKREKPSELLQELVLPFVGWELCSESMTDQHSLTSSMICAGRMENSVGDICNGDSGGGYVMNNPASGRWVLTGIVSWSIGQCDSKKSYSMFTNVGKYYNWIEATAKVSEEEVDMKMFEREMVAHKK